MPAASPTQTHLPAALIATLIVTALVMAVPQVLSTVGRKGLEKLLVVQNSQKDMGVLQQRLAFEAPNVLPLYGSSELTRLEPNRADQFFASSPTGFKVCPVGAAGNTTLMIAQKIGAQGSQVRGHKLVVVLSTSWFRRPEIPADHYKGSFSITQAMQIMLGGDLDSDLRRRFAQRMLDYPDTLKDQPALEACVREAAKPDAVSSWLSMTQRPMLYFQRASLSVEDGLATLLGLVRHPNTDKALTLAKSDPFSWEQILSRADEFALPPNGKPAPAKDYVRTDPPGSRDKSFIDGFGHDQNKEWMDFELLLDTLKHLQAKPLIIAVPLDGQYEEAHGLSPAGLYYYYNRLEKLCAKRGFPLAHFPDHDQDKLFVVDHSSHVTGKGWLFVNHLLDDFYHDRLPATAASPTNP